MEKKKNAIRIELVHHGEAVHKEIQGLLPMCMCKTLGQLIMLLWCVDDVQDDTLPIQKNLGSRIIKYQLRSGGEDGINMN